MTSAGELWIFAGVIVLGQFSPGPDMILLTRTALGKGPREGVRMAAGIACGLSVHSTIAVAGMAVAFQRLPVLRVVLQWVAAAYLTWLAYGLLRERFVAWYGGGSVATPREDGRSSFVRGLLCNLLNPKAALFLAAVCAPFLAGQRPAWWPYATLVDRRGPRPDAVVAVGCSCCRAGRSATATGAPPHGSTWFSDCCCWPWRSA